LQGDELNCERCGYTWIQKGKNDPKVCPKCNSPYWEKPLNDYWKKRKEMNEKRNNKKA
jgi:hypothetical protein